MVTDTIISRRIELADWFVTRSILKPLEGFLHMARTHEIR